MDKDKRRKKKRRKKSKSGFTLIEIIGVIIIIGIIAIITVPAISKYVNNSREKTYITYEENMKVATENKVVECISGNDKGCYLPDSGGKKIVYLNELVEDGYMDSLKDPENDGFCSNELSYVEVTNTDGANYEYKACLYCGNYTTEDAICTEYEFDGEKPVCGTVEGESTKWTNSNRTIIVGCSDSSSGCRSNTFSKTFTETTKNGEVTIVDRSGNTTTCPVEVYVDKTMPKCTLEIVGGTEEATGWLSGEVSVKLVSWSDSDSGVLTYGIGTSINNRNYNKQTTLKVNNGLTTVIGYVKDYAGNEGTCAVDVRVGAPKPEFDIEYGYQIYPNKETYTLVNMTESGTKLTSTTTEPQISFTGLNDYKEITRVRIRFNTAIPTTTTAQLFYSNGTYTEANSVKALLVQGQKIVEFVVPKGTYTNLRFDLGELNNTTYDIEKIEVMVGDRSTLFTNQNVSVNLIPKNEVVRTTNYSFDNGTTWQDINYKDYTDNITGSARTKNIATLIADPAKTYKIENIDKGVPKVTITAIEKTNGAEVESNVWVDDNLNFKLVSSKVGASGATIYYCKDTNNTCNPTTEVGTGVTITAFNTTEGIYYIRYKVVSGAGTSSEISSYTAKVDKTKPTITSITGNPTAWTNQDVTLVINGAKDNESNLHEKPYSFNGGETWQASNSKIYTANTNNIVIKVRDVAGNVYTHTAINITKVDKEKPTCELKVISGSQISGYYYTDVTVGFSKTTDTGGSEVKEYGIGDFTTKTVTLAEDKTVTYTGNIRDNAGNTNICTITVRRQNTFTLTYDSNGGNACNPISRDISYGKKYGTLCSPTRAGYSFAGWYTEENGGTLITADTTVTATDNQTIYAHWTKCVVGTYNTGNKSTCTACPTGYTSLEGSTAENQCYITIADGKYLATAKTTTQTACPAGQYKASHNVYYGNTSVCSTCATGTYSTGGAKVCAACPNGYTSQEGATAQNKCYITVAPGKYIATANTAVQTACPAGTSKLTHDVYYGDTSSCTKCAAGTYSTGGAAICSVCPNGYTSQEGATAQNKCYIKVDGGNYIKTANSAAPVKCAAGTSKAAHTVYYGEISSCTTCTVGTYSLEGAASCSICPTGYTSLAGATAQNKCYITVADGKYLQNANDTIQAACPAGTFKTQHNVYYGNVSSCSSCAVGTFSTGGAKACTTCPTGYTSAEGATAQNKCYIIVDAGKYIATKNTNVKTNCPAGTASEQHNVYYGNTSSCGKCQVGTYSPEGSGKCLSCPTGYTSDEGATAQNKCYINVEAGKYIATANSATKSTCAAGTAKAAHKVNYGSTSSCATCTVGTYSLAGAGTCSACPTGYTSAEGATAQNKCYITIENGKYLENANTTIQTACPAGTYKATHTVNYGSTSSCSTCAAGTFSTGGATSCTKCPTGYTSAEGATAQNKCYISVEAGKYIATSGTATKSTCAAGTAKTAHTVYYGETSSCTQCSVGTYSTGGTASCTTCPTGYTSAAGATAQNKCYISVEAGKYIATSGTATKSTCAAGYAKAAHTVYYGDTSSCGQCTGGTFSLAGAGSCSTCPTGYTSAAGATAQNKCYITIENGKYLATANTTTQTACPAGTYKATHTVNYGSTSSCSTCAAGTFSTGGATTCTTCPTGYTSATGATAQNKCYITVEAGKYIGTANSATKTNCAAGTASSQHTVYYGSTSSCGKCAAGTYSLVGSSVCTTCPTGYTSDEGATAENKCYINVEAGKYIATAKSATKSTCAAGTSKIAHTVYYGNTSSCGQCTVGTYSTAGSGTCSNCPTGYTSAAGATAQNKCYITVANGKYLGTANGTATTNCPAGKYKAQHTVYYGNTSSCDTCAAGTFSTGGATTCTTCPTGYTSDAGATAQNKCYINVVAGKYLGTANGTTQTNCPAGTASLAHKVNYGSTSSCGKCAAGTYSTEGTAICSVCPTGYTSDEGATAQNKCYINVAAGKYLGTANGTATTNCPAGTSKAAHKVNYGNTSSCTTCAIGTYSGAGAGSCSNCPTGYTSAAGATAQNKCYISLSDGQYLGTANSAVKNTCAAGTAKKAHTVYYGSTSKCDTCTAGTYSGAGAATCTDCPGSYTSAAGATAQSKCYLPVAAGSYLGTKNSSTTTTCPAGTASLAHNVYYGNTSSCGKCAVGTYSTAGTAICSVCPSGYTSDEGATAQNKCYIKLGDGQYLGTAKSSTKNTCAAGTAKAAHTVYYGSTSSCTQCGVGTYSAEGAASCSTCPTGYTSAAGATAQNKCYITVANGKYLGTANTTTTTSCAAGKYKAQHTVYYGSTSSCDTCAAGTFSTGGATTCTDCPGSYTSAAGATAEDKCYISVEAGKYIGTAKSSTKNTCAAGTSSSQHTVYYGKTSSCGSCGAGTYSAAGSGTCASCPTAYPNSAAGSDSIEDCYMNVSKGYYVKTAKDTSATKCSGGYARTAHTVYYGKTSTCSQCGTGKYSAAGAESCSTCPTAYPNSAAGSDAITDCYMNVSDGYYVKTAKDTSTTQCSAGTSKAAHKVNYNSTSSCTTCAAGTYSAAGAASCSTCSAGTSSSAGASLCTNCSKGTYSAAGAASCTACPTGYTTAGAGTTQISSCYMSVAAGKYVAKAGDSSATACPNGQYRSGSHTVYYGKTSSCTACPDGYPKTSSTGSTAATQCYMEVSAGYYVKTANDTTATKCLAGTAKEAHTVNYGGTSSCGSCAAGTYNTGTGSSSCTTCPAGYYCTGGSNKTVCPAGTYRTTTGGTALSSCTTCPAGSYCTGGTNKTACPAGTYRSSTGGTALSSCTACSAGTSSSAGATSCSTCAAGTYTDTTGKSSCTTCPAGYYCTGGTNKTVCPAGTYRTSTGGTALSSCTTCPAGSYCTGGTAKATCPTGYTSAAGATAQSSCYISCTGGYIASAGASSCTACPKGSSKATHTVNYGGTSSCSTCAAGTYTSSTGQSSCSSCAAGTYNTGTGNTGCTTCSAGTYNTGTGNTSCTTCPAGSYCTGGTAKATCPTGYTSAAGAKAQASCYISCTGGYIASAGASSCTACPKGKAKSTHTVNYGYTSSCDSCAAGKYTSSTGQSSCSSCAAGTYNTGTGNTGCTTCSAGTYNTGTGNTSCTTCPAGSYCTGGTAKATCPTGYTSAAGTKAQASCYISCTGGYIASAGASSCTACPAGKAKSTHTVNYGGTSSCDTCTSGYWSPGGVASCNSCPSGYGNSAVGSDGANDCYMNVSAGYRVATSQSSQVTGCAAGTYKIAHTVYFGNTSTCTPCGAGKYNPNTNSTSSSACLSCPAGTYQGSTGASSCGKCAAGTYSTGGATVCTKCPAGSYNQSEGNSSCTTCPAGYYCGGGVAKAQCTAGTYSTGGAGSCTSCPSGYTSSAGATAQSSCYISVAAGKYLTTAKGTTTASCSGGTYKDAHNVYYGSTSSCTGCPSNYPNSASGSDLITDCYMNVSAGYRVETPTSSSIQCAAGTYSSAHTVYYGSHSSCTSCPTYYTSAAGATSIYSCYISCGAGKYKASTTATSCTACPAGTYRTGHNGYYGSTSSCYTCSAGTYNTGTGNTSCTTCPAGYYCTGGTNKTPCPEGTVRPGTGGTDSSGCTACATGKYNSGTGNTSCETCPAGYYCPGGSNKKACPAGTYRSSTGGTSSSSCSSCSAGYYSTGGASSCTGCPSGYTSASGATAQSSCYVSCSGGTRVASAGATCTNCSKGTYRSGTQTVYYGSTSSCTSCPSGYTTSGAGTTSQSSCYITCSGGYIASSGASSCTSCAAGKYRGSHTVYYGSTSYCYTCSAGKYSKAGATYCSTCASGYTSSAGASYCYKCSGSSGSC